MNGIDVGRMSLWQFMAAVEAWERANSPKQTAAPSDDEFEAAMLNEAMREVGTA